MANTAGPGWGNYTGSRAQRPPETYNYDRDPTPYDTLNYVIMDLWRNNLTNDVFILISLAGDQFSKGQLADWVKITLNINGFIRFLAGNNMSNVAPTALGVINVIGDTTTINITGNPGTNTLTANLVNAGTYATSFLTQAGTAVPNVGVLTIVGAGGITTAATPGTSTVTITGFSGTVTGIHTPDGNTVTSTAGVINFVAGANMTITGTAGPNTITFAATGVVPNYSTGTFLPVLSFGGASVGIVYVREEGTYTKIGNTVNIFITIEISSKGASVGAAQIAGLPFALNPALSDIDIPMTNIAGLTYPAGTSDVHGAIISGATTIQLNGTGSGVGVANITNVEFSNTTIIKLLGTYFTV